MNGVTLISRFTSGSFDHGSGKASVTDVSGFEQQRENLLPLFEGFHMHMHRAHRQHLELLEPQLKDAFSLSEPAGPVRCSQRLRAWKHFPA